jgi:UDP-2,3-diacylglucosamine pyrophosphatase LpxH
VWIPTSISARAAATPAVARFLSSIECETLYLVGDIVDGWRLSKGWYWPAAHNEVVRRVLPMAHRGTRVVLIAMTTVCALCGDELWRCRTGARCHHVTADGRPYVTHGDGFDGVVLYARWLAFLGDKAYEVLLKTNRWVNVIRRQFKLPYWSLSAYGR